MNTRLTVRRMLAMLVCATMLLGSAPCFAQGRPGEDGAFQAGAKSLLMKNAVLAVAKVIRVWGPRIGDVTDKMDAKAVALLMKHSAKVARQLEKIAEIPDVFPRIVKEMLYNYLVNVLRLDGGSANVIAIAVEAAIQIFAL